MKIRLSLFGAALCVCAAAPSVQAQTLTATGPYVAVTDRNVYPEPPLPVLGPAGSAITDPVFQSPITRITDGATRPGYLNYSFRTPSSPHQNAWSANGSYFYVVSTDGTVIPFRFDATTGTASRINPTLTGNGGLTLLSYTEPQFSYVDDSIIYVGYSGTGTNDRMIDQYDFSTGAYTQIVNLDSIVAGLSGTYIGGIASSAGPTERIETFFGGTSQDHHHYVLVLDRANPSNQLLLDTWASTLNGQPTPITLDFSLHHVAIDRSGRYVMLYTSYADQTGTRQAPQSYVWDTQTGSFFPMTVAVHPYGHDALGYGVSVNQDCCTTTTWDAAQWQFRSLDAPAATRDMLPTVLSPEEVYLSDHTTWNNASPTSLVPYVSATFRYGNNTAPWRALDDEIVAIETDAPGQNPTIWRFAHHRSNVASDVDATSVSFWYEPRPNVSDDGKWVLFTSNWEKTLGTDPRGDSATTARQDVFVVKLSTAVPAVSITTTALPSGRESIAYSAALQATGGSGAFVWAVTAGALPSGVTLDPATGVLSGVPTVDGTFTITVSATDAAAATNMATATYAIAIAPPPVAILTSALAGGRVTVPYAAAMRATGGSGGYVWSIASGSVPSGLTLDASTGAISGTPQMAATSTFNVNVADAADPTNTALVNLSIVIAPSPIAPTTSGIAGGQVGMPYAAILQATGGSGSYVWALSSGVLPAGLALNTATGEISGTPQTAGTSAFAVSVTDAADATNTASVALSIDIGKSGAPLPGWNDQDVGATGATGSAAYSNGVFTVQGAGADVWGTSDAFNYLYLPLAGDGSVVARVTSVSAQANWVKAGVMIRGSLDPSSAQAFMLVSHAKGVAFQRRTADGNASVSTAGSMSTAPRWLKLVRTGSTISGYESADGATWTLVGSDTFTMSSTALVGLAVSSHLAGTLATAVFDSVSTPLASGWTQSDIGSVPVLGSASAGSVLSVTGSGADIWGSADAFHYVYRPLAGDGTVVARVASIQDVASWVKAGVMIRETLDANAAHAFVLVSASKGVAFQRRDATGGTSVSTAGSTAAAPHWVKLTRSGDTFTAYESSDGVTWTEVGSDTIPMAATVYVGLAVTSHSTSSAATCVLDNVSVR